jgi:hypothetical protein
MENNEPEYIDPRKIKECLQSRHEWVPIIEGIQTVGVVCQTCGKSVRENMEWSFLVVSAQGLVDLRSKAPSRKAPRF